MTTKNRPIIALVVAQVVTALALGFVALDQSDKVGDLSTQLGAVRTKLAVTEVALEQSQRERTTLQLRVDAFGRALQGAGIDPGSIEITSSGSTSVLVSPSPTPQAIRRGSQTPTPSLSPRETASPSPRIAQPPRQTAQPSARPSPSPSPSRDAVSDVTCTLLRVRC